MNKLKELHIGQDVLILALALLTVFLAVLSVMALTPVDTDVKISETITVSSSRLNGLDEEEGQYLVEINGVLRNATGKTITVSSLTIPVDGSDKKIPPVRFRQENIVLPPRASYTVSALTEHPEECTRTGEITAVIDGKEVFLRNPAETELLVALIPAFLTLLSAFFLVRACKVRYYMYQEDRADRAAK